MPKTYLNPGVQPGQLCHVSGEACQRLRAGASGLRLLGHRGRVGLWTRRHSGSGGNGHCKHKGMSGTGTAVISLCLPKSLHSDNSPFTCQDRSPKDREKSQLPDREITNMNCGMGRLGEAGIHGVSYDFQSRTFISCYLTSETTHAVWSTPRAPCSVFWPAQRGERAAAGRWHSPCTRLGACSICL